MCKIVSGQTERNVFPSDRHQTLPTILGVPVLCRRRGAGVARWLAAAAVAGKKWRNKERRARGKDDNETLRRKPRLGSSEGGRKKREETLASAKWKREKRCKDKGGRDQG